MTADRAASVLALLLNRAKAGGEDYNLMLNRFVLERLLYRLSISAHANSFLLKGAMLFSLWYDTPHRRLLKTPEFLLLCGTDSGTGSPRAGGLSSIARRPGLA